MIRNVVMGKLAPGASSAALDEGLAAIAALTFPGMRSMRVGRDLGLREGGWDFAITVDFTDVEAYRVYDSDPRHNQIRHDLIGPVCESIARVQFEI